MEKVEFKGSTLLAPLPLIMASCGNMESSNIITVAWAGITNSMPPKAYISVRKERYSYDIIKNSGEFVMNLTTASLTAAADFCGFRSGRDTDKFALCKLTKEKAKKTACPLIGESPLSIECRVTDIIPLGSHDMFLADILCVNASPSIIDESGKLRFDKAGLAAFAHGEYYALGLKLGKFGYSIQKKNTALISENARRREPKSGATDKVKQSGTAKRPQKGAEDLKNTQKPPQKRGSTAAKDAQKPPQKNKYGEKPSAKQYFKNRSGKKPE